MKPSAPRTVLIALTAAVGAALATVGHTEPAERQAYYGDLHLHTSYSFDAYVLFGAKVDTDAAYRFSCGESVDFLGASAKRNEPLDFLAVTDHSENIGVFNTLEDPDSELSKSEIGQEVKREGVKSFWKIAQSQTSGKGLPGVDTHKATDSAWQREIDAANRNYQPGKFTTFIAYE